MSNTYNGWTNYETWATNLHMDGVFHDYAEEYRDNIDAFADFIQEAVKENIGLDNMTGLAADLMNAAMSEVNWHEIAQGYLDGLGEVGTVD